jgi:hypothetical protein
MSEPLMRTSFLQATLQRVDALKYGVAPQVIARLGAVADQIRESTAEWAPVELGIALNTAVADEVGLQKLRRWQRANTTRSFERPTLAPVFATLRIFGVSPIGGAKIIPRSWDAIFRDCGRFVREASDDGEALLWLRGPPSIVRESSAYLEAIAGGFEAFFDVCATEGEAFIEHAEGDVLYTLAWGDALARRRASASAAA